MKYKKKEENEVNLSKQALKSIKTSRNLTI